MSTDLYIYVCVGAYEEKNRKANGEEIPTKRNDGGWFFFGVCI